MLRRLILALTLGATALVTLAAPGLAGGWAVTILDSLPEGGFRAGETYRLGYMIRQHGVTPFAGAQSAIVIESPSSGEKLVFGAVPEGPVGHYVAEVRFPAAGEWNWRVLQTPFEAQALGTTTVAAAPAAPQPAGQSFQPALTVGVLVAFGLVVWLVLSAGSRRRVASATGGEAAMGGETPPLPVMRQAG